MVSHNSSCEHPHTKNATVDSRGLTASPVRSIACLASFQTPHSNSPLLLSAPTCRVRGATDWVCFAGIVQTLAHRCLRDRRLITIPRGGACACVLGCTAAWAFGHRCHGCGRTGVPIHMSTVVHVVARRHARQGGDIQRPRRCASGVPGEIYQSS